MRRPKHVGPVGGPGRRPPLSTLVLLLAAGCAVAGSCDDGGPSGPERTSPMIEIVFPVGEAFDRDGDGLVDVEIGFADAGSGIDPETVEVTSSRPLGPDGTGGEDLLAGFEIVSRDSTGVVLEETTDALLPGGAVELRASVEDRAGNGGTATRTIILPAGSFHRRLPSPIHDELPVGIVLTEDGEVGFLQVRGAFVPFDPWTLEMGEPIELGGFAPRTFGAVHDPTTDRVYGIDGTTGTVHVVDPRTLSLEGTIPVAARGTGITRGPSGLLYVSLSLPQASVAIVDPVARRQVRVIRTDVTDPLNPGDPAFIRDAQVPVEEDRLYVPVAVDEGGVLVVDIESGEVIERIDANGSTSSLIEFGKVLEGTLDRSLDLLYVALFDTAAIDKPVMVEIDVTTNEVVRSVRTGTRLGGKFPKISPSGRRIFLTLASTPSGNEQNWLIDRATFEVVARIREGVSPVAGDNESAFRPDGQLVFTASNSAIGVYLNREP